MCVIDDNKELVFLHIYKTGGTTVRELLPSSDPLSGMGGHADIKAIKSHFLSSREIKDWRRYYKFTFVRNPFSWHLSHFKHIQRVSGHKFHDRMKDKSLMYFLEWFVNEAMHFDRPKGSNKFQSLCDFTRNDGGEIELDFVARFEDLERDARRILDKIGEDRDEIPVKNKGNNYDNSDYRPFYGKKERDFVEEHFEEDLLTFNYHF